MYQEWWWLSDWVKHYHITYYYWDFPCNPMTQRTRFIPVYITILSPVDYFWILRILRLFFLPFILHMCICIKGHDSGELRVSTGLLYYYRRWTICRYRITSSPRHSEWREMCLSSNKLHFLVSKILVQRKYKRKNTENFVPSDPILLKFQFLIFNSNV